MKRPRAPRSKKRIACDLSISGERHTGIALDLSATGLFVQTNLKPEAGAAIEVQFSLPGSGQRLVVQTRVARANIVPVQLLVAARGGVGLAIVHAPKAYLDFLVGLSPEQAKFAADVPAANPANGSGGNHAGSARAGGTVAGVSVPVARFRIHAVETTTGRKNSYIVKSENEDKASAHVQAELGSAWQVLFVERV